MMNESSVCAGRGHVHVAHDYFWPLAEYLTYSRCETNMYQYANNQPQEISIVILTIL